jgi:hypothetical protein
MSSIPIAKSAGTESGRRHRGPSLLAVAIVFAGLFVGSLVVVAAATGGAHFPSPFAPAAASDDFFAAHRDALRFAAFLQFGASVPLVIFAATASSRLRFLGIEAAGTLITLVGGVLASAMSALSALLQWTLVQADLGTDARALLWLSWLTGGPGVVVPFGLLVAGIAVTGGLSRKLPRWVMASGIVVAAAAELSSLSLVFAPAMVLLPIARFTGLAWLVVVGALLPSMTGRRNA